jgi:Kef-type K+ transport system membrane component KefB
VLAAAAVVRLLLAAHRELVALAVVVMVWQVRELAVRELSTLVLVVAVLTDLAVRVVLAVKVL